MMDTVWAAITMLGKRAEDLTDEQQQVIVRIVSEPDSIFHRLERGKGIWNAEGV